MDLREGRGAVTTRVLGVVEIGKGLRSPEIAMDNKSSCVQFRTEAKDAWGGWIQSVCRV